jgi:hypothetical protein
MLKARVRSRGKDLLLVWQAVGWLLVIQTVIVLLGVMEGYPSPTFIEFLGNLWLTILAGIPLSGWALFSKSGLL